MGRTVTPDVRVRSSFLDGVSVNPHVHTQAMVNVKQRSSLQPHASVIVVQVANVTRFTDSLLVPLAEINPVPFRFFGDPLSHGFTALQLHVREVWRLPEPISMRATNVAVIAPRDEARQS